MLDLGPFALFPAILRDLSVLQGMPMVNRRTAGAFGAINLVSGVLIAAVASFFLLIAIALSGGWWGWEETLIVGSLPVAGVCLAISGSIKLAGTRMALKRAVLPMALAIGFALVFLWWVLLPAWVDEVEDGGNDYGVLIFQSLLLGLMVLVGAVQVAWLSRQGFQREHRYPPYPGLNHGEPGA
jgi:hypothetical protein